MIRRRLTLVAVLTLAVALVVVTAGFSVLLSRSLESDAAAVLQTRAEAALAAVRVVDGAVVVEDGPGDESLDATTWVIGTGTQVLLGPAGSSVPAAAVTGLAHVAVPTTVDLAGETRLLAVPIPGEDPSLGTVVVSLSLAPYETTERTGLLAAIGLDVVTILVVAVVARWLVAAALRPVDEMTRHAREWAAHDVDRRFSRATAQDDEIGRLGETLNDLLARLGSSLRHERRLTDEIAHELRTPLARARIEAELAVSAAASPEVVDALGAIIGDIDELAATVDTLLDTARGRPVGAQECELGPAVGQVVAAVRPPPEVRVTVGGGPAGVRVGVDGALLRRIVHPQVENAVKHARTAVTVTWSELGPGPCVEVRDDGPGVSVEDAERVFLPGERGEPSRGAGLGLGLALARRLARGVGGEVEVRPGDGGLFRTLLPPPYRSEGADVGEGPPGA